MADFHAPNMAYSPKVTANRITTARELTRAQKVHKHKLTKIARRRRQYKEHQPKHRHLRQNLKGQQLRRGVLRWLCDKRVGAPARQAHGILPSRVTPFTPFAERDAAITRENVRLYHRMTDIMAKGTMVDTRGEALSPGKSLNVEARRRNLARIAAENLVR